MEIVMKYFMVCFSLVCAAHVVVLESNEGDVIQGYYHAWWVVIPLPKDTVRQMLPGESFDLAEVSIADFPVDHHPVFMEIGFEKDCGPIGLKPFWMDFEEFKYDIPYIVSRGSGTNADDVRPLNYKSVLYMPTFILAESARLSYNLNASKADVIKMTDSGYKIRKGRSLEFAAEFQPDGEWETGTGSRRFTVMKEITCQTWFGSGDASLKSCGNNHYDYDNVKYRSAMGTILADNGIVSPYFPSDEITVSSLNRVSYGAVEVFVNFTISAAFKCLS